MIYIVRPMGRRLEQGTVASGVVAGATGLLLEGWRIYRNLPQLSTPSQG